MSFEFSLWKSGRIFWNLIVQKNKFMYKYIFTSIGVILSIVGFIFVMNYGLNKNEKRECYVWAEQNRQYEGYYFTSWQLAQCKARGVSLAE